MKHKIIVAGICVGTWLCGSVWGQTTVVTNLVVLQSIEQGTSSTASGEQSTALGEGTLADGQYSHAEGDTTTASAWASHAEGSFTVAGGEQSHAEGLATEALAENSHAGGTYSRVREQDWNSFIHATGTGTNDMKETLYPDTAHFDRLVTLEPAVNNGQAVLSRAENDERYLVMTNGVMRGELNMDESSIRNVAQIDWHGDGIDLESRSSTSTNEWTNWNADMLDGLHAVSFATAAQGALADTALQPGTAITVASVRVVGNTNTATGAAVAGGFGNTAGEYAFVGAGNLNAATGLYSFVGGGRYNSSMASESAVVGGYANLVYSPYSAILAGQYNRVSGTCSVVVGGYQNGILSNNYSQYSGIVSGYGNEITRGNYSLIGGGYRNRMYYPGLGVAGMFIGGGLTNFTGATGATIPGGYANVVTGKYGFAAGYYANVGHQGAFVWSDMSSTNPFSTTVSNQFLIRATGGVGINTNVTDGKALVVAGDVEVAGSGRFSVGLRVPQQGDISMGSYTNGTF